MVPNGGYGWLLLSEGAYRYLSAPTGVSACLLVSEGAYCYLWAPTQV